MAGQSPGTFLIIDHCAMLCRRGLLLGQHVDGCHLEFERQLLACRSQRGAARHSMADGRVHMTDERHMGKARSTCLLRGRVNGDWLDDVCHDSMHGRHAGRV